MGKILDNLNTKFQTTGNKIHESIENIDLSLGGESKPLFTTIEVTYPTEDVSDEEIRNPEIKIIQGLTNDYIQYKIIYGEEIENDGPYPTLHLSLGSSIPTRLAAGDSSDEISWKKDIFLIPNYNSFIEILIDEQGNLTGIDRETMYRPFLKQGQNLPIFTAAIDYGYSPGVPFLLPKTDIVLIKGDSTGKYQKSNYKYVPSTFLPNYPMVPATDSPIKSIEIKNNQEFWITGKKDTTYEEDIKNAVLGCFYIYGYSYPDDIEESK